MSDFVSDDHADAPIIQWVGLPGTEEGGLQNASREDWRREDDGRFVKSTYGIVNDGIMLANLFPLRPLHLGR